MLNNKELEVSQSIIDQKIQKLIKIFSLFFYNENKEINKLIDIYTIVNNALQVIDGQVKNISNQVEIQIKELKSSILSLCQILPLDPLENSGVIVFNTNELRLLKALADPQIDSLSHTDFGTYVIANHIHLRPASAIHGAFIFFRLGHKNKAKSIEQIEALKNFARFAHRHCFHIYFNIDNAAVIGLDDYFQLPASLERWIAKYKQSHFHKTLTNKVKPYLKRRMTNVFNDYLIDTKMLQIIFPEGKPPKAKGFEIIDKICIAPPVSFIAQQLVENYEKCGFAGNIFGMDTITDITSYHNNNPRENNTGRSFTKEFDYKYSLTIWNILSDLDFEILRDQCLFTPLQRQVKKDPNDKNIIIEKLAIAEAQTLLPKPENFKKIAQSDYYELSHLEKNSYNEQLKQKMFNSLNNVLLEDLINRGVLLVIRNYFLKPGRKTEKELYQCIYNYMTVYTGRKGSETYDFEPLIKEYEIVSCEVVGQRAIVKIKIIPNALIGGVDIAIELTPSHLFYKTGRGGGQL